MSISGERTIEVSASAPEVLATLLAVEAYPDWQRDIDEAEVLSRDADGRPDEVRIVQDAQIRKVNARVRYEHRVDGFSWALVEGDVNDLRGSFELEPLDGGATRVSYRLEVDPGGSLAFMLRGPLVDRVRDHVMDGTLQALKARVEATA